MEKLPEIEKVAPKLPSILWTALFPVLLNDKFKNALVIHEGNTKQISTMTVTLYLIKLIHVRKNTNEHRILYKRTLNEKAKTTNNGLTARVLSSQEILGLRPRIFKLDKTLPFVL